MVNTRSKGMRNERKAVKELERMGWLTYRVKGSSKWNRNVDIFGLWDIFAIQQCGDHTETILIQVKTNKKPILKPFKTFAKKYPDIN